MRLFIAEQSDPILRTSRISKACNCMYTGGSRLIPTQQKTWFLLCWIWRLSANVFTYMRNPFPNLFPWKRNPEMMVTQFISSHSHEPCSVANVPSLRKKKNNWNSCLYLHEHAWVLVLGLVFVHKALRTRAHFFVRVADNGPDLKMEIKMFPSWFVTFWWKHNELCWWFYWFRRVRCCPPTWHRSVGVRQRCSDPGVRPTGGSLSQEGRLKRSDRIQQTDRSCLEIWK